MCWKDSSMGYVATTNGKMSSRTENVRDEMRSGIAALWPASGISIGGGELQGIFEYATQTFVGCCSAQNRATAKAENAADLGAGVRYLLLNSGLGFDAGFRINSHFDRTDPRNVDRKGFVAAISYTKPSTESTASRNRKPIVTLETDTTSITTTGTANLTASAFDPDNDKLTYTYTATGGQVAGTGNTATFRANGAAPGRYIVRVVASDGKGGTADAEVEITVR